MTAQATAIHDEDTIEKLKNELFWAEVDSCECGGDPPLESRRIIAERKLNDARSAQEPSKS